MQESQLVTAEAFNPFLQLPVLVPIVLTISLIAFAYFIFRRIIKT